MSIDICNNLFFGPFIAYEIDDWLEIFNMEKIYSSLDDAINSNINNSSYREKYNELEYFLEHKYGYDIGYSNNEGKLYIGIKINDNDSTSLSKECKLKMERFCSKYNLPNPSFFSTVDEPIY